MQFFENDVEDYGLLLGQHHCFSHSFNIGDLVFLIYNFWFLTSKHCFSHPVTLEQCTNFNNCLCQAMDDWHCVVSWLVFPSWSFMRRWWLMLKWSSDAWAIGHPSNSHPNSWWQYFCIAQTPGPKLPSHEWWVASGTEQLQNIIDVGQSWNSDSLRFQSKMHGLPSSFSMAIGLLASACNKQAPT